jgi:hypothetical protein
VNFCGHDGKGQKKYKGQMNIFNNFFVPKEVKEVLAALKFLESQFDDCI